MFVRARIITIDPACASLVMVPPYSLQAGGVRPGVARREVGSVLAEF
jgi:hypothetical protein